MSHSTAVAFPSTGNLIWRLIVKDWTFVRTPMAAYLVLGLIATTLLASEQSLAFYIGTTLLISVVVIVGAHLVFATVVKERSLQTLPLVMSLPITFIHYSLAKLGANIGIFVLAWLPLLVVTLMVIGSRDSIPNGLIPYAVIVLTELFLAFVAVLAVALITESEPWTIVTMSIFNIGVSIFMFVIGGLPGISDHIESPVAVWNGTALLILAIELVVISGLIAVTLFVQSRKTDFL